MGKARGLLEHEIEEVQVITKNKRVEKGHAGESFHYLCPRVNDDLTVLELWRDPQEQSCRE